MVKVGLAKIGLSLAHWFANVGVLVEFGWPDAERISSGRLLSQFGRVTSIINGPFPVAVLPGCIPDARNMGQFVSRRWFESEILHLLDDGLHNRATVGIASLSVVHKDSQAYPRGIQGRKKGLTIDARAQHRAKNQIRLEVSGPHIQLSVETRRCQR